MMTDDARVADESNPGGYFELERTKGLGDAADRSWVNLPVA